MGGTGSEEQAWLDIASHTDAGCQELLIVGKTVLKVQTAPWSHGPAGG